MKSYLKAFLILVLSIIFVLALASCRIPITKNDSSFFDNNDEDGGGKEMTALPSPASSPEAPSDNWTIMIYMNGSDLESEGGEATANLQSLLSVALPQSVEVLIYTGGTAVWQNDTISPDYNQIWRVADGDIVLEQSIEKKSMGESDTLSEFIMYAQGRYPADKKALFFWNHGAGSIEGFGADELFDYDALRLGEMQQAMNSSFDGQKFALVGFDACLMASIESASVFAPYADYMIASEEIEPGGGWDYAAYFGALAADPYMSGEQLGMAITDGYYNKYKETEMEGIITCSVIDLEKIPALEQMLGTFSAGLSVDITTHDTLSLVTKARINAKSYGDEPGSVSFDMIDLYGFVDLQKGSNPQLSSQLMQLIEEAVVYEVSGSQQINSYGLSIYFPFAAKDYFDYNLGIYENIDFCPEYQQFAKSFAATLVDTAVTGQVPDFESTQLFEDNSDGDLSDIGSYYVQLTDEELDYMSYVYCVLGWYLDDGSLVDLGFDSDLYIDYSDNTVHDNFGGWWTGLNGQPVTVYVMEETEEYIIYNIPVMYNGDKAVVKGAWIWDETHEEGGYYTYNGIFYSNDEYAAPSSKLSIDLMIDDAITPLYSTLYAEDGYEGYYEGDTFYVDENGLYLELIWLPDGYYQYGFMFIDIYGETHYSEFTDYELFE